MFLKAHVKVIVQTVAPLTQTIGSLDRVLLEETNTMHGSSIATKNDTWDENTTSRGKTGKVFGQMPVGQAEAEAVTIFV
jgi:hypothetical protein